jgi:cyclase
LLLKQNGLVKTVGDPINAVKIFNEKEVDEIIFLDITATIEKRRPNFQLIEDIASEAFMPFAYGGGIRDLSDVQQLFSLGVEKIILNTCAIENPTLITKISEIYGSQSVVISIDVGQTLFGKYEVFTHGGRVNTKLDPVEVAKKAQCLGAGEIFINSIDKDGTLSGYDIKLVKRISDVVGVPVIACGGASCLNDFALAVKEGNASAVSAGSFFVFHGKHKAVLITYPSTKELETIFF